MVIALAAVLIPAGVASAAHVARLDVSPQQVAPGGEVTVSAAPSGGYGPSDVTIRWDSLDGPILGTFPSDPFGPEVVTIPDDATPGKHVLIADQEVSAEDTGVRGIPARAVIEVIGRSGDNSGAAPEDRRTADALPPLATLRTGGVNPWTLLSVALVPFAATLATAFLWRRARGTNASGASSGGEGG